MKLSAVLIFLIMVTLLAVSVSAETIVITGEPALDPALPLGLDLDTLVFLVSMICTSVVALATMLIISSKIKRSRR